MRRWFLGSTGDSIKLSELGQIWHQSLQPDDERLGGSF